MSDLRNIHSIVTHAGDFHVDELMAVALLRHFVNNSAQLTRTRATDKIRAAQSDPNVAVVDVGRVLDEGLHNFDHHQDGMDATWDNGTLLSSCGLVWKHLREHGYLTGLNDAMCDAIEQRLIVPIDAHDNGQSQWEFAPLFRSFNRSGSSSEVQLAQFEKALSVSSEVLTNTIHQVQADLACEKILREAWNESKEDVCDGIVIVRNYLGNREGPRLLSALSEHQANILLTPSDRKGVSLWTLRCLTKSSDTQEVKYHMPPEWSGENKKVDFPDGGSVMLKFCHKLGFMAIVEGSGENVYQLARRIIGSPEIEPASRAKRLTRPPGL